MLFNGKNSLLPPKSPFPSISPSYIDYVSGSAAGPKAIPKPRDGISYHHRTSSESYLIEEQPSWLDELLNEPETPVRRGGHRRSSSDSFAYLDSINAPSNMDFVAQDGYKLRNQSFVPSWGPQPQGIDPYKGANHASFYAEPNPVRKHKNRPWGSAFNSAAHSSTIQSARDNFVVQSPPVSSCAPRDADGVPSTATEKQDAIQPTPYDLKASPERKDSSGTNSSASETDTKRAKQQFAQRSRVRKLQYIAELERNVQLLQADGSEVSAELEFLNQQNLILSMENKALKQRLENLSQEQLIKYLEHEVLEREIGRLRALYQQQQQQQNQPPPPSNHRRTKSRDLDSQFANLSIKQKNTNSSHLQI